MSRTRSSPFRELCDALNTTLTPALRSAGYAGPHEEFSPHTLRYEFTRPGGSGTETIAILFNRARSPQFTVQLYVEPPAGLEKLETSGGALIVGALSPCPSTWPFAVRAFGQQPSLLWRLLGRRSRSAAQAVQSALDLLPEIERWWGEQRTTKFIISGKVRFPGR